MSTSPASRNDFTDPKVPSIADVIDWIKRDETLPLTTRRNWLWVLKLLTRSAGKDPTEVPAHPKFIRMLLQRTTPEVLGISRPAFNNARSLIGQLLRYFGLASIPYKADFTPPWAELWQKLPSGRPPVLRAQLGRSFHYFSARAINPSELCDVDLENFHQAMISESMVKRPYDIYRKTIRAWNQAREIAGWPQQRLTVPSHRKDFSYPWRAFPAQLEVDVKAYSRRAGGLDLNDDHFSRALRPATIKKRELELRQLATAIVKAGLPADALIDLPSMLKPEIAASGLQYLRDRNDGVSNRHISDIAEFLPTLARRLDMPGEIVTRLRRMAKKLEVTQHGMSARNREALRAFDDQGAVEALLSLPYRILRDVQRSSRRGYREAKLVQIAVAIEVLLNAPVRPRNLASIDLERHLLEVGGERNRTVHFRFPAAEVKNANDLEFPLMKESIQLLEIYLSEFRPVLMAGPSPFLFPARLPNRHKGEKSLSKQIKQLVFAYTRLDMPAHRFRHAVGKIFLDRNPGQYEIVRLLLGHKSIQTTINFYCGAESAAAARHYAKTILGIRAGTFGREAADD
jgi:integrase